MPRPSDENHLTKRRDYAALSLLRFLGEDVEDADLSKLDEIAERESVTLPDQVRQLSIV